MKKRSRFEVIMAVSLYMLVGFAAFAFAQKQSGVQGTDKKETKGMKASGEFDVKMTERRADGRRARKAVGRFSIDKTFYGGLKATSWGEMLAVVTTVDGSAGYVAMEQVTGTLNGRSGTFALQHSGTMTRGAQQLSVTVVPDSGTGELTGLAGQMTIKIDGGKHLYEFQYTVHEEQ